VDGLVFINALRRQGGWTSVNRAWADPPTTTEQILHLEKFAAREPAIEVTRPSAAALGAGWTSVDEDTYGEQGLRLIFEEWLPATQAKLAASGWGGDRGALYTTTPGKAALALRIRYDEARGANKDVLAERAFKMVGDALLGTVHSASQAAQSGVVVLKESGFVCVERPRLGPLALRRVGRDVAIVAGPTKIDGTSSISASSCAQAKVWTQEVAR
jgi:hypothetical protein